ncbi:hypothetical protein JIG36_38035 [Actinoplanes sp. LDG1-06]|uniref:Uncharacterized protein n=1 Tax=Paractinoplanes ovalisporus TaxID=2810368 RepID=A0ABS2AQ56_9ACTN|nr:hypothetical protein [Actinoplanes ovalisporus]MBM2621319.1 hypothetical protein [Actinoplanes ovalisporus]
MAVSQAPSGEVDATFGGCERGGRLSNNSGVGNEETEAFPYVCRQLPAPWNQMWPGLRHFS